MKRYVMTRPDREFLPVVTVVETDNDGYVRRHPLEHLVHKSCFLDWTQGAPGPGAGNAPSDLARSIVGDLLGEEAPVPALYRQVTLLLARIPYEGGELTEEEVLDLIDGGDNQEEED